MQLRWSPASLFSIDMVLQTVAGPAPTSSLECMYWFNSQYVLLLMPYHCGSCKAPFNGPLIIDQSSSSITSFLSGLHVLFHAAFQSVRCYCTVACMHKLLYSFCKSNFAGSSACLWVRLLRAPATAIACTVLSGSALI